MRNKILDQLQSKFATLFKLLKPENTWLPSKRNTPLLNLWKFLKSKLNRGQINQENRLKQISIMFKLTTVTTAVSITLKISFVSKLLWILKYISIQETIPWLQKPIKMLLKLQQQLIMFRKCTRKLKSKNSKNQMSNKKNS